MCILLIFATVFWLGHVSELCQMVGARLKKRFDMRHQKICLGTTFTFLLCYKFEASLGLTCLANLV